MILQIGSRTIGFLFWTMGTRKGARPFTAVAAVATVTAVVVVVAADFVAAVVPASRFNSLKIDLRLFLNHVQFFVGTAAPPIYPFLN